MLLKQGTGDRERENEKWEENSEWVMKLQIRLGFKFLFQNTTETV